MSDYEVHIAAEGFERELTEELGRDLISAHGRLVLAKRRETRPAWAQNTWLEPREIRFESITQAAKALRALAPHWSLHSHRLHRRAQLIQDKLPKVKAPALDFLDDLETRKPLGAWTLMEPGAIIASPTTTSRFPDGEPSFNETKSAPSRAYLKLWELFTVHGVRPKKGDTCVEMGASPGGWTWVLANLGCEVLAVDRSPLAPEVSRMPGVSFRSGNAFAVEPESVGKVDWFFSDLICAPEKAEALIHRWRARGGARNFVCTLKFKGHTDHATAARLAALPGSRLAHLAHNKHELTWWLIDEESLAGAAPRATR